MATFTDALLISCGACFGALGRWGLALAFNAFSVNIPPGTLLANWLGSLLMGLALAMLPVFPALNFIARPAFVTGFLGSFTTFSTFAAEMGMLLLKQKTAYFIFGVLLHLGGSIGLFLTGLWLGKIILAGKNSALLE